ncbi:hypothetical protein Tco_1104271 [Tanacetum coccineum]
MGGCRQRPPPPEETTVVYRTSSYRITISGRFPTVRANWQTSNYGSIAPSHATEGKRDAILIPEMCKQCRAEAWVNQVLVQNNSSSHDKEDPPCSYRTSNKITFHNEGPANCSNLATIYAYHFPFSIKGAANIG